MTARRALFVATVGETLAAFLQPHARHLRAHGWIVEGAANGASARLRGSDAFDVVHDLPFSRRASDWRAHMSAFRSVRSLVRIGRYDIVHVHTPIASLITRVALRDRAQFPFVAYTAHGFHFAPGLPRWRNTLFRSVERLAARWCDGLIVINSTDHEEASRWGRPARWLRLMPGVGLDLAYYSDAAVDIAARNAARARLGLGSGDRFVVVVAELNSGKRHRDVLHAFTHCDDRLHLVLLGDGALRGALQRLASELGISARVHFLGQVRDPRPFIVEAAALVLASEREGLPRCVMEAMALRTPVVGSSARGTRDLLEDGAGWLYPVGRIPLLVEAIGQATAAGRGDPRITIAFARSRHFSAEGIACQLRLLYEEWLSVQAPHG